jgi:hypothetical protein
MTETIEAALAALDNPPAGETIRLAEENQRLSAENRRLRQAERRREVNCFMCALRDNGQLTPAMELAGLEEALFAAEEHNLGVLFPDGRSQPLGQILRAVLSALPSCCCTESYSAKFASPVNSAPPLSADEQRIAAQLGLSEQEFAALRTE